MSEQPKKMSKADAGRKGGQTTKARHGTEHYRRAGKLGFAAAAKAHAAGNAKYNLEWLRARGKIATPPEKTPEQRRAALEALYREIHGTEPEGAADGR